MTEVFRKMPVKMTVLRVINRGLYQNSILDEHEGIKKSAHKKYAYHEKYLSRGYQNDRFACYL